MMLILDNTITLDTLNSTAPKGLRLTPITLTDGRYALPEDLLSDCGAGKTWEHYCAFLEGLPSEDVAHLIPTADLSQFL